MKHFFLISIAELLSISLFAQQENFRYVPFCHDNGITICDIQTAKPSKWSDLIEIVEHPGFDRNLTKEIKDSLLLEINKISKDYPKDSLLSPDLFYIFKPYFMWLRYVDPHYRVNPSFVANSADYKNVKQYKKDISRKVTYLPFNCLNINDTLLVHYSLDSLFKRGDMILSINGTEVKEILKFNYPDRLVSPTRLMANYYQKGIANNYNVTIIRKGKTINISSKGRPSYDGIQVELSQLMATEKSTKIYGNVGYVAIPEFFSDNSRLIKLLKKTILSFKSKGVNSVILDLRNNPGGYGDRFDELLSLFINQKSIPYMKKANAKLSEKNIQYYNQPSSKIGEYYELLNEELISTITLQTNEYIPGVKYYILMNQDTGSIAASFCNIMQYNNAAILLGEPLLHNALSYGEGILYSSRYPNSSIPALLTESRISSVEFDEYSNVVNGILYPDYYIECSAMEYNSCADPVLEKAIDYAKTK